MMDFFKNFYGTKSPDGKHHKRSKSMTKDSFRRVQKKVDRLLEQDEENFPYPSKEMMLKEDSIYDEVSLKLEEREGEFNKTKLLLHVVKQLSAGADLFRIGLPPNLLSPLSMLEYISRLLVPTQALVKVARKKKAEDRFKTVLAWLVTNFSQVPNTGICHAKPLNPILGEIFRCKYLVGGSECYYFAEQISHHPPEAAIWVMDKAKTFTFWGNILPKSKIHANSAATQFNGKLFLRIHALDEVYEFSLPSIVAYGTLWGQQYIEMNGALKVGCEKTGFGAKFKYKTKSKNAVSGSMTKGKRDLYTIRGRNGDDVFMVSEEDDSEEFFVNEDDYVDFSQVVLKGIPLIKMDENESRRVWHRVIRQLLLRKFDGANRAKHHIEEIQRDLRKERKRNSTKHEIKWFTRTKKSVEFKYDREKLDDNRTLYNF